MHYLFSQLYQCEDSLHQYFPTCGLQKVYQQASIIFILLTQTLLKNQLIFYIDLLLINQLKFPLTENYMCCYYFVSFSYLHFSLSFYYKYHRVPHKYSSLKVGHKLKKVGNHCFTAFMVFKSLFCAGLLKLELQFLFSMNLTARELGVNQLLTNCLFTVG